MAGLKTRALRRNPQPISVFISYSHDDAAIAKALEEEISSIDQTRFKVFLDFKSIELGGKWKLEIAKAVDTANMFIAIFTGNQKHVFDYCGYEVGLFSGQQNKGKPRTMYCLYDTKEPPAILADLQNIPIV